ncbi:MAG: AMP-binding protein, partial [Reyranellales bacterium]
LVPGADRPAGAFTLDISALKPAEVEYASISDRTETALVRPGGISQSAGDLAQAARSIGATLRLAPADRCLNVLPLFDADGLIGALLSSLAAGASVCCSPGFEAPSFFTWLAEAKPTWYAAEPAMHEAILAQLGGTTERAKNARLRFVRSSPAPLPPAVKSELEAAFGCPVIEAGEPA